MICPTVILLVEQKRFRRSSWSRCEYPLSACSSVETRMYKSARFIANRFNSKNVRWGLANLRKSLHIKAFPDDDHGEVVEKVHDQFGFFLPHVNTFPAKKSHRFFDRYFRYAFLLLHRQTVFPTNLIGQKNRTEIVAVRGCIWR